MRFKEMVRKTPLEYLTTWRMQKAATSLHDGNKKLIDVATTVGYNSDSAHSAKLSNESCTWRPGNFAEGFWRSDPAPGPFGVSTAMVFAVIQGLAQTRFVDLRV